MTPSQQAPSLVERQEKIEEIIYECVWAKFEVLDGVNTVTYDGMDDAAKAILEYLKIEEAAARITELETWSQRALKLLALREERAKRAEAQCRVLQEALAPFARFIAARGAERGNSLVVGANGPRGQANIMMSDLQHAAEVYVSLPESPSADAGPYPRSHDEQRSDGGRG